MIKSILILIHGDDIFDHIQNILEEEHYIIPVRKSFNRSFDNYKRISKIYNPNIYKHLENKNLEDAGGSPEDKNNVLVDILCDDLLFEPKYNIVIITDFDRSEQYYRLKKLIRRKYYVYTVGINSYSIPDLRFDYSIRNDYEEIEDMINDVMSVWNK